MKKLDSENDLIRISENGVHFESNIESKANQLWLEEIIRETDHYYEGEIQQEQRSSWLLATSSVLMAIVISIQVSTPNAGLIELPFLLIAIILYAVSSITSIITILPLVGNYQMPDIFGKNFRSKNRLKADQFVSDHFKIKGVPTYNEYCQWVINHFRSHHLRNHRKSLGVLWSSIFLILGLIFLGIEAVILLV